MTSTSPYSLGRLIGAISQNFSLYLIGLLLLAAGFAGGSLWTENRMLRSGGSGGSNAAVDVLPADSANAPSGPSKDQIAKLPEVVSADFQRGAKNPKVTLVEYSDFECPFCKSFHTTMNTVMEKYGDDVKWVFRHYPLPFHANAQKAAETAECVAKLKGQDGFWQFSDLYFSRTTATGTGIALDKMAALAAEVGASQADVQKCLDSGEMATKVSDQQTAGGTAGVSGTPSTFVVTKDGVQEIIPGALPLDSVESTIKKYL